MPSRKGDRSYTSVQTQILNSPHYYALLGVNRQSTAGELKSARRDLLKYVHPDVNSRNDAHQLSVLVNLAYFTLAEGNQDVYVSSLKGKKCIACRGAGAVSAQKGFTKTIVTTCKQCKGAGVV